MTAISSAATGLASATTTWVGGVVPVQGDSVTIAATHVVTLDGAYVWGDDTATGIQVFGDLIASTAVNSSLTCYGELVIKSGGGYRVGSSAAHFPAARNHTLLINDSAALAANKWALIIDAGGDFELWGDETTRVPHTKLTAATVPPHNVINVLNATGWATGDAISYHKGAFSTGNVYGSIQSIVGNVVTVGGGIDTLWTPKSAIVYNMVRNINVHAFNPAYKAKIWFYHFNTSADAATTRALYYANIFDGINGGAAPLFGVSLYSPHTYGLNYTIEGSVFKEFSIYQSDNDVPFVDCFSDTFLYANTRNQSFNNGICYNQLTTYGISYNMIFNNCHIGNSSLPLNTPQALGITLTGCNLQWGYGGFRLAAGSPVTIYGSLIIDPIGTGFNNGNYTNVTLVHCDYVDSAGVISATKLYNTVIEAYGVNNTGIKSVTTALDDRSDSTAQWKVVDEGVIVRDTAVKNSSVASIRLDPQNSAVPLSVSVSKVLLIGTSLTVSIMMQKNTNYNAPTLPLIRVHGVEFNVTASMSAASGAFELVTLTTPIAITTHNVEIDVEAYNISGFVAIGSNSSVWVDDFTIDGTVYDIGGTEFIGGTEISNVIDITDTLRHFTLTGLQPNTEVRIYNGAGTELAGVENSGTTFDYAYNFTGTTPITVNILNVQYEWLQLSTTLTNSNTSIPIQQRFDRNYL